VENEKTFFQELYEALEAETRDNTDAANPTRGSDRGSEDLFMATDPPPGGGGENRVQDGFTYIDSPRGYFPQKTPKATPVGAPLPPAKPPVGGVCKALLDGPQRLLELLQEIARSTIPYGNRALWRKVGTVVFLLPLEMVALNLGVSRQTVYSWRKKLEEKGLVATDVLHEKVGGEYRAIGTLWAVRLRPGKARLTLDDYIYPWRNLATDIANGVLSYAWVRAFEQHGIRPTLDTLVLWAQGKRVIPNTKTVAVDLGLILILPEVEEAKRPMLITLLSTFIANVLDDQRSRRFFAGLLWGVVRGEIPAQYLFALLVRVIRDYTEGFLTKPGAYLVKTLKTIEREAS
jgi:DNA-binding transcriptional ArsR family regulator